MQKGVGWVTLNHGRASVVAAVRAEHPAVPVGMVVIDNVEFGRIQARQLRALRPGGGAVLCVSGNPFDSASQQRTQGLTEGLQDSGLTAFHVDGRWDAALAETAVYKWLASPLRVDTAIHALASQNDPMALAARTALARAAGERGGPRPQERRRPRSLGGGRLVRDRADRSRRR